MAYLERFVNKIRLMFLNSSIRYKMLIVFMAFMISYICVSTVIYVTIVNRETFSQVKQRSYQTTGLIKSNIYTLIENTNNISNILTTNSAVRKYLASPNPSMDLYKVVNEALTNIHITFPNIDSVYLYDLHGSNIRTTKYLTASTVYDVRNAPWYEEIYNLEGKYKISINAENTLLSISKKNLISVMRVINDIDSLKPIGVLVLNISESSIAKIIAETEQNHGTSFMILDSKNQPVIKGDENFEKYGTFSSMAPVEDTVRINNEKYFVYRLEMEEIGWKVISFSSLSYTSQSTPTLNIVYVFFIGITLVFFILASIFTANLITSPIKKLIKSMQGVTKGVFKRVSYNTGNDEIGELKNNYNLMILEINNLITQLVDEEKIKRKFELGVLNEQIKPHFLYNTLDNIAFLALSDNNKNVYDAVNALGSFYRISLSKGSEIISLGEEIKLIKNYLALQKLRYGEMISDQYNVDSDTLEIKIVKNILQPLVENSIYHGIRPGGEPGLITISSHMEDGFLSLSVADTGIGMEDEEIKSIASDNLDHNQSSFGLRGTIQRLKIYYGTDDIYKVESQKYAGTKITLKIPLGGNKDELQTIKSADRG